jgi:isopentenyl-diphosphate delta-isomerase
VAQLEDFLIHHKLHLVKELLENLQVDGLIIHVNPLQEWMQPEGDRFKMAPIDTIKQCLLELETKIIVKEVGQGFGPNSLISLMKLPLAAIDFAGHGGTNFTALELSRHSALSSGKRDALSQLSYVGHRPEEMIQWANEALHGHDIKCKEFIISGGISDALTGRRLRELLEANSVIGMGNAFLKVAEHYDELCEFITVQIELLKLAKCYLKGR